MLKKCAILFRVRSSNNSRYNGKVLTQSYDEALSKLEARDRELAELRERLASSRELAEADKRQVEAHNAKEVDDLLMAQKGLQARLAQREDTIRKLQRDLNDIQLRAESQHLEMRRATSKNQQDMNARLVDNELEIAKLRGSVASGEAKATQLQEQVEAAVTVSSSEKALMRREKDIVSQKLTDASLEVKALKDELAMQAQQMMAAGDQLREKEAELARVKLNESNIRSQLDRARGDLAESDLRGQRLVEAVRHETKDRLLAVQESIRGQLEAHQERSDRAIRKERLRSEAYKKKALLAYEKYKSAVGAGR